eukprot:CAMPEP_0116091366 /NCGR_PEP_ID=MMETSP0327-20121206/7468_1 /TAXON_ID=44447 /ORGANISM="Pseudo-nitzschia delicatissima, Strain B596" /LENGTH=236 /DNA_ID=CAMNT_0003582715 /DNA_START=92 /DNA_END=802 /DNA_ORIENTATION=-
MQRRTTQQRSNDNNNNNNNNNSLLPHSFSTAPKSPYGAKQKRKKATPFQALILGVITIVALSILLTPSQKHELVEAEHKVEEWVKEEIQTVVQGPKEKPVELPNDFELPKDLLKQEKDQKPPQQKHLQIDPSKKNETPKTATDSWVEREKNLKKKLRVLFDQQAQGKNLGVPVLTRYLGEHIPAFVGTPDVTMKEEEWKTLVDQKYTEMREQEDAWQAKMALFIEQQDRNPGITTP